MSFGAYNSPIQYTVIRKKRWPAVILGAIAVVAGAVAMAMGILSLIDASGDLLDERVGEAGIPGGTVSFEADDGPYSIILLTPGFHNSVTVERQVGAAVCEVDLSDGSTSTIRGSRQGMSVSTDDGSTIGWFTATAGPTTVTCEYTRSVSGRDFAVVPGKPPNMLGGFGFLFGGIVAGLAGIFCLIFGLVGRRVIIQ